MNFTVNKEIGGKKLEFVYEVNEGQNGKIRIGCKVEGYVGSKHTKSGMIYGCKLIESKNAIVFTIPQNIVGKKVSGINIPEEIFNKIKQFTRDLNTSKETEKQNEKNDLLESKKKIKLSYHDGEILSGYQVFGQEAELLVELGLAKYVDGWGHLVNKGVVEALSETFNYSQSVEFAQTKIEAAEKLVASEKSKVEAKFEEAKETGQKVVIGKWSEPCNDNREECNLDMVTKYAMLDGSVKVVKMHTW